MIDIKDISKWYGTFQVLTNCTTSIQKGGSSSYAGLRFGQVDADHASMH
jgi:ABC-type polar amino acid transport system ATPase subunit